jgi:glucosylceramidase
VARHSLRLLTVVVAAVAGSAVPTVTATAAALPAASVWLTTVDGSSRLSAQPPVAFRPGGNAGRTTVTVDPTLTYQTMQGFGASITDSSARVLYRLSGRARHAAMQRLFSPTDGDGLSLLRQPIGASDFVDGPFYTYDDLPAGHTDYRMRHFSVQHDRAQILPLLREALRLNPAIKVLGTPWSPPAWMKTSQSLEGGRLIDDPRVYTAYASYLLRFVQAYRRAGVPVYALTLQNEPQNRTPDYPGTDMPVAQEAAVAERLGPMLRQAHLPTKLFGYDHNWQEHPNDVANTPPGQDPETDYPYKLMASPAGKWFTGVAYHCYYGDPSDQTAFHNAYPDKQIWFTECSGSHGPSDPPAQVFSDTLKWHARNLVLGVTRNWGQTVVNWNLALDPNGNPHHNGCSTCSGVVTVNPDGTVTYNAEYYTLGHLSRFVQPGAVRIASTSFGTTGWNGQLMDTAFRDPDGTIALVVHNESDDPKDFTVAEGNASFDYTLPGGALATFTWPSSPALHDGYRLLPPDGFTATAVPSGSGDQDPARAVDPEASTRWSSGTAQTPGQSLTADLGRIRAVRRVVLDTGPDRGDYPRGYAVSTSTDGTTWSAPVTGPGTGQLTVVDLPGTPVRYVRITQTAAAPQWWTVADLRLYS